VRAVRDEERALDDLPDFPLREDLEELLGYYTLADLRWETTGMVTEQGRYIKRYNGSLSAVEVFSGKSKQIIRALIEFCRAGGFGIE
jgi:CYTH domain-containing protein